MRLGREQEDGGAPGRLCPATPRNLAVLVNALPRRPVLGRHLLTSARAVVSMLFGTRTCYVSIYCSPQLTHRRKMGIIIKSYTILCNDA